MTKKWPRNDQEMTKKWPRNDQEMTKNVNDQYHIFSFAIHEQSFNVIF